MRAQIPSASCLVVFSICSSIFGLLVSARCLNDQKSALLSLKKDLTYDALVSTKLVGWNQSIECCDWGGVTCDEAGHVTQLNLYKEGIRGVIPWSHWEGLKNLQYLSLGYNSLDGNLPKSLLNLPSLEGLDLSNNKLSGQISNNITSYQLRNLDLSSNRFEGPLPEFILKLPAAVSTLTLSANKFSGSVELDMFGKFKELYSLDLSYNHRLTVHVNANSSVFSSSLITKLNSLMLASCKLQEIPDVRNQSSLKMLDLSDNELSGEIPNWIWDAGNGYLRFLNLSHNRFSGLQKPYTFPFLLDVLDLHSNILEGDIPVPPRRVYILDYSNNNFKSSIPVGFGNVLRSTLYFSMSNSKLVGVIPESIGNASSLRLLDLSRNALTGSIPEQLQSGLASLSFLNLSYNHLSGRIPQGPNFKKFTELSFEGNEGLCGPPLNKTCM